MNPVVTVTGFWDAFITKIAVFLPNLFFAIAIILLGWVICNVIKRIVVRLLKLCQFDILAERSGIKLILDRGGIRQSASDILGLLVFNMTFRDLVYKYAAWHGETWLLITIGIFLAPSIAKNECRLGAHLP